ncbi:MAG: hypothetical protein ACU0A5_08905 [Salipiger marinus]|uniref:hypothetical protein n=1 Tax=Salipiger marinus TaxID=555512 RepID=UPI004059CA56
MIGELDALRKAYACDIARAQAKAAMLDDLEFFLRSIEAKGCRATLSQVADLLVLKIDPNCIDACVSESDMRSCSIPEPELLPESCDFNLPAEARVAVAPEPEGRTLRTGDWTEDEEQTALLMDREGASVGQIATALNRRGAAVGIKLKGLRRAAASPVPDEPAEQIPEPAADAAPQSKTAAAASVGSSVSFCGTLELDLQNLNSNERVFERRLRELGYPKPWSPEMDHELAVSLIQGNRLDWTASKLKVSPDLARLRWHALLPEPGWDNQRALLAVLKARAARPV